jgi:hypothetical protein
MNQLAKDVMWGIEIWMDSGDVGAGDLGIEGFTEFQDDNNWGLSLSWIIMRVKNNKNHGFGYALPWMLESYKVEPLSSALFFFLLFLWIDFFFLLREWPLKGIHTPFVICQTAVASSHPALSGHFYLD